VNQRLPLSPSRTRSSRSSAFLLMPLLCGLVTTFCATASLMPVQAQDDATDDAETTEAPVTPKRHKEACHEAPALNAPTEAPATRTLS
jgi:hypothetical protein